MVTPLKISEKNRGFFDSVFEVTRMIPPGRVTSYGAIARFLGMARSSRLVGHAMHASHSLATFVPAHRVVNRNGVLTGKHHFGGSDAMQQLLEKEGIEVRDDRVVNFESLFWDPAKEIDLNDF